MNREKGIWELEDGCINIQSGEEKKKKMKNEQSLTDQWHTKRFTNTTVLKVLEERGVRKGQVKNN